MKQGKISTYLWFCLGLLFALLVLLMVCSGLTGHVLMTDPAGIPEAADAVLNCIHAGNWPELESLVSGQPAVSPVTGEEGSAEKILYDAFRESLQWTREEPYHMEGSFVTQAVTVTCLDIPGITDAMADILAETTAAQDTPQLLCDAANQILQTQIPTKQHQITLTFEREQGRWLLVPNQTFRTLLSAFTA